MRTARRRSTTGFGFTLAMSLALLARTTGVRAFVGTGLQSARHQPNRLFASVTGSVYESEDDNAPKVTLFTKEGCTLCDKVKDVLKEIKEDIPHSLEQVDITDDVHREWFGKYKYDIPVLHLNGQYWLKHRTDIEEAKAGLEEAKQESFQARPGEPNAEAMERN